MEDCRLEKRGYKNMNILLYLHGNTYQRDKVSELLNIVCSWKLKESKIKIFLAASEKLGQLFKEELKEWDIEKIFILENIDNTSFENIFEGLNSIIMKERIISIIMGNSIIEREVAPYLAAKYKWKYISNVIDFKFGYEEILWKRFLYGTKAIEKIKLKNNFFVATIASNIFRKEYKLDSKKSLVIEKICNINNNYSNYLVISSEEKILQRHSLETAKIVVGVGKGIKGKENFPMIEELAKILGATIGVTRSVVDNGWRPEYEKIGQTGKIIKPELYIGFGISGAMQHMAGVQQARHVVMVNINPNAEVFRGSDLGIVADMFDIVPRLIKNLKK